MENLKKYGDKSDNFDPCMKYSSTLTCTLALALLSPWSRYILPVYTTQPCLTNDKRRARDKQTRIDSFLQLIWSCICCRSGYIQTGKGIPCFGLIPSLKVEYPGVQEAPWGISLFVYRISGGFSFSRLINDRTQIPSTFVTKNVGVPC